MKKQFLLFLLLIIQCSIVFSQSYKPFSLFLIGDAGEDTSSGPALLRLKEQLNETPNSTVVFLGDNVYPAGLNLKDSNSIKRMESQLKILNEYKGQVYFIPGNHDWNAQKPNGANILKDQQVYVTEYLKNKTTVKNKNDKTFLPENALPGPETVMLNEYLRLVIIDTQWFLHYYKKNKTGTKANTKKIFYSILDSILNYSSLNNQKVIIAAHHPIYTNGQHSKKKQPLRFLINYTPLQIFGLLGLNRLLSQDIEQPRYKRMRKKMISIFEKYPHQITYVSGHDHNLQLIHKDSVTYIVSGGGSKLSKIRKKKAFVSDEKNDMVQDNNTGYVEIVYDEKKFGAIIFNGWDLVDEKLNTK